MAAALGRGVGLEHPDQLAEISAELRRLGRETRNGAAEPFDIAVELEPGSDPAPYAAAGATWGLVPSDLILS